MRPSLAFLLLLSFALAACDISRPNARDDDDAADDDDSAGDDDDVANDDDSTASDDDDDDDDDDDGTPDLDGTWEGVCTGDAAQSGLPPFPCSGDFSATVTGGLVAGQLSCDFAAPISMNCSWIFAGRSIPSTQDESAACGIDMSVSMEESGGVISTVGLYSDASVAMTVNCSATEL